MRALVAIDDTEESRDAIVFAQELLGDEHEAVVVNVASHDAPAIAPLAMLTTFSTGRAANVGVTAPQYPLVDPITGVTAPLPSTNDDEERAEDRARETASRAAAALDTDEALVEFGDPATRIVDVATEHEIDLIIVGTRDRGAFHRFFSGSVSRDVLEHAPCPVLIVR